MGIINLSMDSFYEKSRAGSESEALEMAARHIEDGADLLDIGAESSRPGSDPVSEELEERLLLPLVDKVCKNAGVPISVDTYKPSVAEKVLDKGVSIINDITGLQKYSEMGKIVGKYNAAIVLMHMAGTPKTMQNNPVYEDLMGEISSFLGRSIEIAERSGVDPGRIAIDPGIGFGKTCAHNLELLRQLPVFKKFKRPILIGVSRKSFIGSVLDLPEEERLEGSLAASVIAYLNGADIIRTHDVRGVCRAIKVARAIMEPGAYST